MEWTRAHHGQQVLETLYFTVTYIDTPSLTVFYVIMKPETGS
jgi:hypothetical protein